jgi:hypothetical protein
MTVKVFRVYTDMNAEPKNFAFSVLASTAEARYIVPQRSKSLGIDDARIDDITRGYYENGLTLPEDHIGWASLATQNMSHLSMFDTDEEYITMEEAIEEETGYVASISMPSLEDESEEE